jgi:hypothetical protein
MRPGQFNLVHRQVPIMDWPQKSAKDVKGKTPLIFVPFAPFCGEQV